MIELNQIICDRCPNALQKIPDDFIDLTVTSPPYDDLRSYNGTYSFDFEGTAKELYRITKPGGVVVWIVADACHKGSETLTSMRQAIYFKDVCGFRMHDTMIYHKSNPMPMTHNRYEQTWEYTFVLSKGKPKTFSPIMVPIEKVRKPQKDVHHENNYKRGNSQRGGKTTKIKGNIWTYAVGLHNSTSDLIAYEHPALFPDALAMDHILSWSVAGEIVLDPFCGSGTTCKMAALAGRSYLGIDCVEKYVEIARQRTLMARQENPKNTESPDNFPCS